LIGVDLGGGLFICCWIVFGAHSCSFSCTVIGTSGAKFLIYCFVLSLPKKKKNNYSSEHNVYVFDKLTIE